MPGSHRLFFKQKLYRCSHISGVYYRSVTAAIAVRGDQLFDIMTSCCHLQISWFSSIVILGCTQTVGHWMNMPISFPGSPPAPYFTGEGHFSGGIFLFSSPEFPSPWVAFAPVSCSEKGCGTLKFFVPDSHLFPLGQRIVLELTL